jgi:hypothetical protein
VYGDGMGFLQYFHLRSVLASERQVPNLLVRSGWNSLNTGGHARRVVLQTRHFKPSKEFAAFVSSSGSSRLASLQADIGSELGISISAETHILADYLSAHRSVLVVMLQVDRFSEWPLSDLHLEDRSDEVHSNRCVYTVATRPNSGETAAERRALSSVTQLMGKCHLSGSHDC